MKPSLILVLLLMIHSVASFSFEWPRLESNNPKLSLHPKIITSMLTKPHFSYRGKLFTIADPQDALVNKPIQQANKAIRRALKSGRTVTIEPLQACDDAQSTCLYHVIIDGHNFVHHGTTVEFIVRALEHQLVTMSKTQELPREESALEEQKPGIINALAVNSAHQMGSISGALEQLFDDKPLHLAQGHTPSEAIKDLIDTYGDHKVIGHALDIIRAADWADFLDIKNLALFIRAATTKSFYEPISPQKIIDRLTDEYEKLSQAFRLCTECSTPMKAQFKQMLGFSNHDGALRGAIVLISAYPQLLHGDVPKHLKLAKGYDLLSLRTALFYIAAESNPADFDIMRSRLNGFYQGEINGDDSIKKILSETILFRNDEFFTPACAYIKNADKSILFAESSNPEQNLSMVFTDCSGFVLNILRRLFPDEDFLKQRRGITTYHLAALFDQLANELNQSTDVFYDHTGNVSMLSATETGALEKLRNQPLRLAALRRVFEPVLKGKELRTGDIIIKRDMHGFNDPRALTTGSEGHALIVVEPSEQPTCVELTSFKTLGYGWKKITMKGSSKCRYRILRFKK